MTCVPLPVQPLHNDYFLVSSNRSTQAGHHGRERQARTHEERRRRGGEKWGLDWDIWSKPRFGPRRSLRRVRSKRTTTCDTVSPVYAVQYTAPDATSMARTAPPCAPKKAIAPSASTASAPVTAGGRAGIGFRAERGARASLPRHGAVCCREREEVSFEAKGRKRVGRVPTQRPGDSIAPVGPCSVDPGTRAARRTRCARGRTGREVEKAPEVFGRRRSEHDGAAVGRVEAVRGKGSGGGRWFCPPPV